jgi:hypothetical protein
VINKGVPGSPMIPYEAAFPEADRIALRDFILSEQEGLREMVRSVYARRLFKGRRFTPELFASVESESQTSLPENHIYMDRNADGVMRVTTKLHVRTAGDYTFSIRPLGRTSVFLNGEEVHYSDEATDKKTHINKAVRLEPGVHEVQIFHEEKTTHSYRFSGAIKGPGSKQFALNGRSIEGNIPVIIKAAPVAKVVRKWIDGLPPRALLCLLPNAVIVAYDPESGAVLRAWHSAEINQTPSLPDRSAKPSEIRGQPIADSAKRLLVPRRLASCVTRARAIPCGSFRWQVGPRKPSASHPKARSPSKSPPNLPLLPFRDPHRFTFRRWHPSRHAAHRADAGGLSHRNRAAAAGRGHHSRPLSQAGRHTGRGVVGRRGVGIQEQDVDAVRRESHGAERHLIRREGGRILCRAEAGTDTAGGHEQGRRLRSLRDRHRGFRHLG